MNNNLSIEHINWKAVMLLNQYVSRFCNIKPRKYTWISLKKQKILRRTIIRARELWLISYTK